MAYPLRNRLRTGMTLAMFTLVVFTLVVGITTPSSFIASAQQDRVRTAAATTCARSRRRASPVADMSARCSKAGRIRFEAMSAASRASRRSRSRPVSRATPARRRASSSTTRSTVSMPSSSRTTSMRSGAGRWATRATQQVWDALARGDNVAVVDPWIVPHRRNWNFGALSDLKLAGFYAEDPTFAPVPLDVRDPETGRVTRFTVIGVLRDTMPLEMAGIATSQQALAGVRRPCAARRRIYFALAPGVDAERFASRLESAFLSNGMQADSFTKLVHVATVANSMVFLRLIEGFMGLGLVVGVAALGVIAARSVVERRQQIGVLRAIGFQATTVRLSLLLESGFLALSSIVVGTVARAGAARTT